MDLQQGRSHNTFTLQECIIEAHMHITHQVYLIVSGNYGLTQFLSNPLNQVNRPNPRFLGFTCRMKPLSEYNGYHSGHFASMTGICIKIHGSSERWGTFRGAFLPLHCSLDRVGQNVLPPFFASKWYLTLLYCCEDELAFGLKNKYNRQYIWTKTAASLHGPIPTLHLYNLWWKMDMIFNSVA